MAAIYPISEATLKELMKSYISNVPSPYNYTKFDKAIEDLLKKFT